MFGLLGGGQAVLGEDECAHSRSPVCCLQALRAPGGNIDSRETDGVVSYVYCTCTVSAHLLLCVCMCVPCSLRVVQPQPRASPSIPHTTGMDMEMAIYKVLLPINRIHLRGTSSALLLLLCLLSQLGSCSCIVIEHSFRKASSRIN